MATFAEYTQQYMRDKKKKETSPSGKSFSEYTREMLDSDTEHTAHKAPSPSGVNLSDREQLQSDLTQKRKAQQEYTEGEGDIGFWDAILPGGATPSEYMESRKKKKQYEKEVEEAAAQVAAYEQFWEQQKIQGKTSAEIDAYIAESDAQIEKLEEEKGSFWDAMKPGGVKPSEYNANRKVKEAEIKKIESQQGMYRAVRDEKKSREMTDGLPEDVKQMLDEFNSLAYETEGTDWAGVASSFAGTPGAGGNAVQRSSADMRIEKIKTELTDRGYDNWVELAEYRKYITDKEAALEQEEMWSKVAEEHPVIASAGARAMAVPSAVAGLYGTVKQSETTADFKGGTPYTPYYGGERARQAIDSTITEGFEDGDILSAEAKAFLYAAGTSAADSMMASIAGGSLGLGKLSAGEVLLGVGAANSVIVSASEKGMTREQAMTTAAVAMASEILFEHASLGKLGAFAGTGEATFKAATKDLLKNSFVNMTEEMATEITNLTFDYYYNGGMSDYYKAYESYLLMGMSEEEAQRAATNDMVMQVVQAGASGALIGGVFSGVNTAESAVAYNSQLKDAGKQIVKEGKTESILAGASDVKDNEGLRKLAAEIERNKNATSGKDFRNIGKLAQGLDEATAKDRSSLIKAAVEKRLTALGEKDGIDVKAEAIVKTLENQTVSKKERAILKDGKYTTRVINEMTDVFGLHSSGWMEGLEGEVEALDKRRYNPDIEGYKSKEEKPTQEASSEEGITDTTEKAKLKAEVLNIVDETEASDAEKNAKEQFKADLIEENQDAEVFDAGFELYYESGKSGGYEFNEVKGNPNVSESFTDYQRQQAFELGVHHKLKDVGNAKYKGGTVDVFVNGYTGKNTVNSYARAFDVFYAEGVHTKKSFDAVMKEQGSLLSFIDEGIARKAFEEGRGLPQSLRDSSLKKGAKAPAKSKQKKGGKYVSRTIEEGGIDTFFEALAGKLGVDIERVQRMTNEKGREANAQIDLKTGKITTSASSINEYQSTIHEIVHYGYAYGNMAEVEKAVKDYFISLHGTSGLENVLRQYEKGYSDLDRAGVTEEFTADALAGMFSTDEGVNTFLDWLQKDSGYSAENKKTILEKLSEWIREIVDAIKELLEGKDLNDVVKSFAKKEIDRFGEIRGMFLEVLDEVEGVSEGVDSTGIRFSKPIKNYPYDMQTVISDYIDSVDAGLLNLINKVKNLSKEHFERYTICEASDKLIKDLKRDLKIDVSGYKNAINTNAIHHIIKRHGAGGKADSSMANDNDIARMRYIIENYDSFELLRDENGDIVYSEEFRNADNTQAPLIKLSKKINGTYYLIEAVPENKYKKIWVVSAYIKNSSVVTQAPKKSGSYLASPTSADNSISNSSKDVNDSSKNSLKQSLDWVEIDEQNVSLFEKVTEIGRINARMNAHILRIGSGLTRRVLSEVNIQKIARQLKGDYMSTVDIHKLTKTLTEYYQLLESGTISGEAAKIYTENICDMLLNESKYMNPDISPAAKETLKEIKSTAISLNETQWKEVEASYGSRAAFRKVVGRYVKITKDGLSLDSRWQELSGLYPYLFDADVTDTDQPMRLVDVVEALKNTYDDEFGTDIDSVKIQIDADVAAAYLEIPTVSELSNEHAKLEQEILREMREQRVIYKQVWDDAYRKAKMEYGYTLKNLRKEQQDEILKARARYEMRAENMADTRVREKKRANIIKQVKRLDRLLRNPKRGAPSAGTNKYDQKYVHLTNIPEGLQRTVIDFCSVFIDNDAGVFSGITKRDNISQREMRIEALQEEYDLLRSSGNYIGASVAEEMKPKLDRIAKIMADKRLSRLSVEELDTIIEVTDHLLTIINNQVEMWVGGKKEMVTSVGDKAIRHAEELGQHKHPDLPGYDFTEKWTADNLKPIYFFEKIGGPLERLFKEILYKGQRDYARNVNQAAAFMDEISKKFDYQSWADEKELTLKTKQGHTLKLTKSQAMHIYATVNRELLSGKESEHLMAGGIVFENEIEAEEERDPDKKIKKRLTSNVWKYKKSDGSAHRISIDDMTAIANYLTEEQRTFVDTVVGYLSKDMAALGNEVSMELYGIRMFDEKYYIPFNSAKNFIYRQMGEQGEAMLRNESFTKRTVHGAKNPLVVGDFMEVVAGHIERMCMYNSMVMPLENFSKIWNYQQVASSESSESPKSVRSTFETAFGKNNAQYVDTLLKDINGGINTDGREKSIGKLLSNFKKTAVLGSASVVIQQPSAIVRAFSEIDVKYFAFSSFDDRKKAWEKALKYSSTALLKDIGGFDTVSGRGTVDWLTKKEYKGKDKLLAFFKDSQFRDDILAWGPAFADRITWAHIWAACEREVAEKRSLHGEELYKATGERFDEVINKTQVYDSVLARSAHMRSKTTTMQSLTAFMAEPTTQVNMLASALWDAKRGEKKKAMKKVASVVASQLFNAMLVSLIYSMRDDDEDKTLVEKYIASVTENFLGSLNPMTMVPIFKDLWSILEGYSIERSDMAVYSNIFDAAKALSNENKTTLDKITGVVGSVGDALGLPLKNIIREGYAVVNTVESIKGVTDTTGKGIFYAIEDELLPVLQTLKLWKPSTKDERLYAAFIDGDKKMYNRLASQYSKGSQIKSALTKQIGERFVEGVIDENQAIAQLQRLGYSENDAYYELRKMTEPVAEEEKGDTNADFFDFDSMQTLQGKTDAEINEEKQKAEAEGEEYSVSGNYSWLEEALESGDKASIQQEVNDLKNRGVSEDDINSRIKSWIKKNDSEVSAEAEKYKSGDLSSFESTVSSVAGKYGIDQSYAAGAIRSAAEVNSKTIEGTIYALGDLHVSIGSTDTGKTAAISKAIVEAKTQAYILDGETRADAQKKAKQSVSQSLTSKWKPIYLASGPAEMNRIRQQLYATGVYDNLTELDEKLKGWREEA